MFTAFTGIHLDWKVYIIYIIISHSALWKIIINLDEGSIFIKGQGKKLFLKNYVKRII